MPKSPAEAVQRLIKPQPELPPLRPKQEAFVREYAATGNASQAARDAGYSVKNAGIAGHQALRSTKVQAAVQVVRQSNAEAAGVRHVDLLKIALHHATYDPALLVDEDGRPLPLHKLPKEMRAVIQGVDIVEGEFGRSYRYRMVPKDGALDKLFRHLGLYEKDNAQSAGGVAALMQAIHAQGSRIPLKP